MAFDEVILGELALLNGYLINFRNRWLVAANLARTNVYTIDHLFEDARQQFVDNWDTWNRVMGLPTEDLLPAAIVRGTHADFTAGPTPPSGMARVGQRLTNVVLAGTTLGRFGGGAGIPDTDYTIGVAGDFDGSLRISNVLNVSAPAAGTRDVYRGLALGTFPGANTAQPIAWLVVCVEP